MRTWRLIPIVLLTLIIATGFQSANRACEVIIAQAMEVVESACAGTGRNQVCYGNLAVEAIPQVDVAQFTFAQVGDIALLSDLQTLRLSPLNLETEEWGVALLKLQANLPDTLPGQNVTFLLFGDSELSATRSRSAANATQAFYLRTRNGEVSCQSVIQSGLLVQTPQGAGQVEFTLNGVDVRMGSTVLFQAGSETPQMTVTTLEGSAYVDVDGLESVIVAGTQVDIPLEEILNDVGDILLEASGPAELPEAYADELMLLETLPVALLEETIAIVEPVDEVVLEEIQSAISAGGLLCGVDPLPACEEDELPLDIPLCGIPGLPDCEADDSVGDLPVEDGNPGESDDASSGE